MNYPTLALNRVIQIFAMHWEVLHCKQDWNVFSGSLFGMQQQSDDYSLLCPGFGRSETECQKLLFGFAFERIAVDHYFYRVVVLTGSAAFNEPVFIIRRRAGTTEPFSHFLSIGLIF